MKADVDYATLLGKSCNNCYYANNNAKDDRKGTCSVCIAFNRFRPVKDTNENN